MRDNMRGVIHQQYSPFTTIGDLEDFAKKMVGAPVTIDGVVVGKVVSAQVGGNYVVWEAMPFHSSTPKVKAE